MVQHGARRKNRVADTAHDTHCACATIAAVDDRSIEFMRCLTGERGSMPGVEVGTVFEHHHRSLHCIERRAASLEYQPAPPQRVRQMMAHFFPRIIRQRFPCRSAAATVNGEAGTLHRSDLDLVNLHVASFVRLLLQFPVAFGNHHKADSVREKSMDSRIGFGEPAPHFVARGSSRPDYSFASVAGRPVLLWFAASAARASTQRLLGFFLQHRSAFDDENLALFIITTDPEDLAAGRLRDHIPGIRIFWDLDLAVSRLYGMASLDEPPSSPQGAPGESGPTMLREGLLLLDAGLRALAWFDCKGAPETLWMQVLSVLASLSPSTTELAAVQAPVLMVARVFEPAFCRELIGYYRQYGGEDSGYMRKRLDGRIEGVVDHGFKRRRDRLIDHEELAAQARWRIEKRLLPELRKAFRYRATRMERYLIACYDSREGGYFRPHRDNDGTGHRQFAVTINLNAEDYEGGDLRFPEYGRQSYRPPTGGACVFSCFLLHEATPVIRGTRYAFLPFLYDENAARLREQTAGRYVDPKHQQYRAASTGSS